MTKEFDAETGPYLVGSDEWIVHQGMRHLLMEMKRNHPNTVAPAGEAMAALAQALVALKSQQ